MLIARRRSPTRSSARSAYQRVDDQTRDAPFVLGRATLDGARTATTGRRGRAGRAASDGGPARPARRHLRRAAHRDRATRSVTLAGRLRRTITAKPDLPRNLPLGPPDHRRRRRRRPLPRARRSATRRTGGDPDRRAVPLREADQQLDRLLVVEALVIGGVLLRARAAPAGSWCGSGLLPLDRMGHTAGPDRGRRPLPPRRGDRPAHRGRPARDRAQRGCSTGSRRPSPRRQASEERLRTFIADASHELRTPLASIRGYAELFRMGAVPDGPERRARDAPDRGRGRAHGRARRGPAHARAAGRDRRRAARRARRRGARRATPSTTRARPRPTARSRLRRRRRRAACVGDAHQLRQVLGNLLRNALVHTPRGDADRGVAWRRGRDVVRADRARPRPRPARPTTPTRSSSASGAPRAAASAARAAPGLGLAIVAGDRRRPRRHACGRGNAEGGGAAFVVELPALRNALSRLRGSSTRRAGRALWA